jgi:glycosyltransferase involved in cell wall biosynthesis
MKKLSIIVPVFNEGPILEGVIQRLFQAPCPVPREFIFVNDGSRDETLTILERHSSSFPYRIVNCRINRGKGAAIREGLKEVSGDYVLIQDADLEYDPADIPALIAPLVLAHADVVYGSRFKKTSPQVHRTYHYSVNRFLTSLSNLLSGIYLTDMETCYKVFPTELLRSMNLVSNRFGIEIELTAYLAKTSARVFELPIAYRPRSTLQGKKISWRDGVAALFHLVRFNTRSFERCFTDLPDRFR